MEEAELDELPRPCEIRNAVEKYLHVPTIFKGKQEMWTQFPGSFEDFQKMLGDVSLDFRIVPNSFEGISWEGNADFVEATVSQFIDWQNDTLNSVNPFYNFKKEDFWSYSSYNYMSNVFSEKAEMLQNLDWGPFGFPEVTGNDSTFWLGSVGANTPCHLDVYGCNFVAQVLGKKKWFLFPPEDTKYLYPTRIPYEESSVFSSVNILKPDLRKHPLFKKAHPYIVVLEENEVLFVPKGWWHFVTNLDPITVSFNTWIKLESDVSSRLAESATRALMTALISLYEPEGQVWLNPKEDLVSSEITLNYIRETLSEMKKSKTNVDGCVDSAKTKISKINQEDNVHSERQTQENIFKYENVITLKPSSVSELISRDSVISSEEVECGPTITAQKILNCFVHPDVVQLIVQLLEDI